MYKNLNKKNHYKIKKFFKEYHSEKFGRDAYQLIENNRKYFNKFRTKKELCNYFNWEVKKPIVLILAHQLTDGNLNNKWNLFQNDMIWMVETIKKIVSIKDVNWLIKPHPSEEIYNTKITTKTIFNDLCNNSYNIKLFPDNLDTKNLNTFIKAAISSHGTAGCEFPGFGVPTIICGDTRYSGLGFNIEPRTKSQYFKILEKIGFLKKIDNKIIKKSQFFIYLYYYLAEAKIPIIHESSIRMNYNQNKFWKSSLKLINKHELRENIFSKSLKFQIKNKKPLFLNLEKIKNFKNKYLLFKF